MTHVIPNIYKTDIFNKIIPYANTKFDTKMFCLSLHRNSPDIPDLYDNALCTHVETSYIQFRKYVMLLLLSIKRFEQKMHNIFPNPLIKIIICNIVHYIDEQYDRYRKRILYLIKNPLVFINLDKRDINICKLAVHLDPTLLKHIKYPNEDICIEAIQTDTDSLEYIENQTNKMCLIAVKINAHALYHVKNQTDEICLAAVKKNGYVALRYVKHQTNEICLAAVKNNGYALEFVKNQTDEICLDAIEQNINAIKYVKNPNFFNTYHII